MHQNLNQVNFDSNSFSCADICPEKTFWHNKRW